LTTVLLGVGSPIIAGIAVVVAIWHVRTHAAISTRSNSLPVASADLLLRSWCVLEPFIEAERRYRRASCQPVNISPGFVTHFEHLVALAHDADGRSTDSKIHKRLRLRKVTAAARSGVDPATLLPPLPGPPGQPQPGVGQSVGDGRGSAAPPVGEVEQPSEGGTRDGAAVYGGT